MAVAVTETGLTLEDLAETAYQALYHAKDGKNPDGQPLPSFDDVDERVAQAWGVVATLALEFAEHGVEERPQKIAQALFSAWTYRATGFPPPMKFTDLHVSDRLAWEAVGRHLAQVLDTEEDVAELERRWGPWAAGRQSQGDPHA